VPIAIEQVDAGHAALVLHQPRHRGPFAKANRLAGSGRRGQRTADLGARRIAIRVQDPRNGMGRFARPQQPPALPIEARAPLDKFIHALWTLGYQHFGGPPVYQSIAGGHGVRKMERNVFAPLHRNRDTTLRVMCVRFGHRFLGDHQHGAVPGQFHRGAQTGNPRSHHYKICLPAQPHHFLRLTSENGVPTRLRAMQCAFWPRI
jgi:hypothetical protein